MKKGVSSWFQVLVVDFTNNVTNKLSMIPIFEKKSLVTSVRKVAHAGVRSKGLSKDEMEVSSWDIYGSSMNILSLEEEIVETLKISN